MYSRAYYLVFDGFVGFGCSCLVVWILIVAAIAFYILYGKERPSAPPGRLLTGQAMLQPVPGTPFHVNGKVLLFAIL